jgi:TonB family protein
MKYPLRSRMAICLICSAPLLAQNTTGSTEPRQDPQASHPKTGESKETNAAARFGGIEVLSDATGVDLGPYLQPLLKTVKQNWYKLSPPSARAPRMMKGEVTIAFAILKNGRVAGMKLVEYSGDVSLDRAAWAAIAASKFAPLPAEYSGQYLALRFHFLYNPAKPSDVVLQYRERSRP